MCYPWLAYMASGLTLTGIAWARDLIDRRLLPTLADAAALFVLRLWNRVRSRC